MYFLYLWGSGIWDRIWDPGSVVPKSLIEHYRPAWQTARYIKITDELLKTASTYENALYSINFNRQAKE